MLLIKQMINCQTLFCVDDVLVLILLLSLVSPESTTSKDGSQYLKRLSIITCRWALY